MLRMTASMKKCYTNGWISPRDGNISYRPENSDFFYITPASVRKNELNVLDIVEMNISEDGTATQSDIGNQKKPTGEFTRA